MSRNRQSHGKLLHLMRLLMLSALPACSLDSCCFGNNCEVPVSVESECWTHVFDDAGKLSCNTLTGPAGSTDVEPNDSVTTATPATGVSCASSNVSGIIEGNDVDMYQFNASLCPGGKTLPTLKFNQDLKASNLRMCLFLYCATGSTGIGDPEHMISGCDGGEAMHLPEGMLGCCTSDSDQLAVNVRCSNNEDSFDGYVVIDGASNSCVPYNVSYSF